MFQFTSVAIGDNQVSTLTFQIVLGDGAGITGAYTGVDADNQQVSTFVIVSAYDDLLEVDAAGNTVATHNLQFAADVGSAANCSSSGASRRVEMSAPAGTGSVKLSCLVVERPTTLGAELTLTPNRMKCDVYITGYTYANALNRLRLTGRVGYNSASVRLGRGLSTACAYSPGSNLCIAAGGLAAYVSFEGRLSTGFNFAGSGSVETVMGAAYTSSWSGYAAINAGNYVSFTFNAPGEQNLLWDPEIGVTNDQGYASTLAPSWAVGIFVLLAAIATLLL
jgi:hypothetical protein